MSRLLVFVLALFVPLPSAVHADDFQFDHKITRPVLESYLSRSITMLDLLMVCTAGRSVPQSMAPLCLGVGERA